MKHTWIKAISLIGVGLMLAGSGIPTGFAAIQAAAPVVEQEAEDWKNGKGPVVIPNLKDKSNEADLALYKIPLEKTKNTRDIGGYQTADGYWQIRSHSLIRSAALSNLNSADIKTLANDYQVRSIVDFRTPGQIEKAKDKVIPGATNTEISVLGPHAYTDGIDGDGDFYNQRLNFGYSAVMGYRKFLNMLLTNPSGSTLYHCSSGKDRTGIATVLIMAILGVPKQDIVNDFMLSQYTQRTVKIEWISRYYFEIERNYGSIHQYISQVIGFSPAQQERFKAKYLISTDGKDTPYPGTTTPGNPNPTPTPPPSQPDPEPDVTGETTTPEPTPEVSGDGDQVVKKKAKVKILSTKKRQTKFVYQLKGKKKWFKNAGLSKAFGTGKTPKKSAKKWRIIKSERVKISGHKQTYYQVQDRQGHKAWLLKAYVVKAA